MATLQGAEAYFVGRLRAEAWYSAGAGDKQAALTQARRQLEPYRDRVDGTRFSYAVYEQALWLLQNDQRAQLQQAGVKGFGLGSMSEQFDTAGRDPTIAPQAWAYLRGPQVKAGQIL